MYRIINFFCYLLLVVNASAQTGEELFLHDGRHAEGDPAIFVNLAKSNPTKAAVLIIPGGGYTMIAMSHEGNKVAEWFNQRGVHAFILRYSLGKFDGSGSKHPDMINDAKRAFRMIRSNAEKWGIDKNKIGVMGFSAGGHLAATLCTHFDNGNKEATDIIEQESCLPNFGILAYPVITMEETFTHWGSRRFLLGPTPSQKDIQNLSNEKQVSGITPPTFIFHTSDDKAVPVQNSLAYYMALRKFGIPVEMHIFEHGNHGVGLVVDDFALKQWSALLENWLMRWKMIDKN